MSFEYVLSNSTYKKNNEKQKIKDNILALRESLIHTGYNPGEIDYLIKRFGAGKSISELNLSELKKLNQALQTQLDIAIKCIGAV